MLHHIFQKVLLPAVLAGTMLAGTAAPAVSLAAQAATQPDLCHQQAAAGVRLPQVADQAEEKRRMIFRRFSPRRA